MYWSGRFPEVLARRDAFWAILAKHRVTAAFFGDEHNYSRTLIDQTVDPRFVSPVWQIITGGCGAPYYARDRTVPWQHKVRVFSAQQHLVLVRIDGPRAQLEALSLSGQILDRWDLSRY